MSNLSERHLLILDQLKKKGSVKVTELCEDLDVSSVTIRKDLQFLESKNLLFRTHGGGMLANPYTTDKPVTEKEGLFSAEKQRIGQCAASLIQQKDCVLVASGTTVLYLAKNISTTTTATIVTSALNVALALTNHPSIDVIQLGGFIRKTSTSVAGLYAEKILEDFSFSKLFLGADGIDPEFGISTTNIMEAQLNRKMIDVAQKTIVLADSSKFGKRGFGKICPIDHVEHIITDSNISDHMVSTLRALGIEVTVV